MIVELRPNQATCRWLGLLLAMIPWGLARAQDQTSQPPAEAVANLPEIADEPTTVDPATLVPPAIAATATIRFADSSLREVVAWLQETQKMVVLVDNKALTEQKLSLGEPISDQLTNAPVYLLLNRLRSIGLAWYVDDDVLHITTQQVAAERTSTVPFNVGNLLDTGFKPEALTATIYAACAGRWMENAGDGGGLELLGDVLFVRQTDEVQREVQGLLAALRQHGRRTFTLDPPQHAALRAALEQDVSVDFVDTPLESAMQELAGKLSIDLRLDRAGLRQSHVREREPVTLRLDDRKLGTVLHILLSDLSLTWTLRDGVLWITSSEQADQDQKTAVFDVRDLCRNDEESEALKQAVLFQTKGPWEETAGDGGTLVFARPGTLVVRHTQSALDEVLRLLETYRTALRQSKPRQRDDENPEEVITRYYRLHAAVAEGLLLALPELVEPDSWRQAERPEAAGMVRLLPSVPDFSGQHSNVLSPETPAVEGKGVPLVTARAVLIVQQRRRIHAEIEKIIQRVEQGDPRAGTMGGMGGMGGFGGGYFNTAPGRFPYKE